MRFGFAQQQGIKDPGSLRPRFALLDEYDVDEATASADIAAFLQKLRDLQIL